MIRNYILYYHSPAFGCSKLARFFGIDGMRNAYGVFVDNPVYSRIPPLFNPKHFRPDVGIGVPPPCEAPGSVDAAAKASIVNIFKAAVSCMPMKIGGTDENGSDVAPNGTDVIYDILTLHCNKKGTD